MYLLIYAIFFKDAHLKGKLWVYSIKLFQYVLLIAF